MMLLLTELHPSLSLYLYASAEPMISEEPVIFTL